MADNTETPAPVIALPDQRMMELIEILKANGTIRNRQQFLDEIQMIKQGYRKISLGIYSFTVAQIARACTVYKVDANWVLGITDIRSPFGPTPKKPTGKAPKPA